VDFLILQSWLFNFSDRIFHFYWADFSFLLSRFSIFTQRIFHFYRADIPL
jgi:hypothetical protein